MSQQYDLANKQGNAILGYINRNTICKSHEVIVPLDLYWLNLTLSTMSNAGHVKKDSENLEHSQKVNEDKQGNEN